MFKNKLYFCFGDFRERKRRYQIFLVDSIEKAHKAAHTLGYRVLIDETYKCESIADIEERMAASILSALHVKLHAVENTVSCVRRSKKDAESLKRHFMMTDMRQYFPKLLTEMVNVGTSADPLYFRRRTHEWMTQYIIREMKECGQEMPEYWPVRVVDTPNRGVYENGEALSFE